MSDAAAYVIADDIARAAGGAPMQSKGTDVRFLPIQELLERLERIAGHDRSLAWLVEPNALLGHRRPLEVLAAGDLKAVQAATPSDEEQFPPAS